MAFIKYRTGITLRLSTKMSLWPSILRGINCFYRLTNFFRLLTVCPKLSILSLLVEEPLFKIQLAIYNKECFKKVEDDEATITS